METESLPGSEITLKLVNINGQVVFSKQYISGNYLKESLDVSNYNKGIYTVITHSTAGVSKKRLVIY